MRGPSGFGKTLFWIGRSVAIVVAKEEPMNKDEVKGKWEQAKGYTKKKVGKATGNRDLETEGKVQQAAGKAQEEIGKGHRKVEKAVKDLRDKAEGN